VRGEHAEDDQVGDCNSGRRHELVPDLHVLVPAARRDDRVVASTPRRTCTACAVFESAGKRLTRATDGIGTSPRLNADTAHRSACACASIDSAAAAACSTSAAFCCVAWSICVTARFTCSMPALCSTLAALISAMMPVTRLIDATTWSMVLPA